VKLIREVNYIVESFFQDTRGIAQIEAILIIGFIMVSSVLLTYIYSANIKSTAENADSLAFEVGTAVDERVWEELMKAGLTEPQNNTGKGTWTCKLDVLKKPVTGLTAAEAAELMARGWTCVDEDDQGENNNDQGQNQQ
jgi:hypothetical protein